jgi:hypothetical protein
VPLEHPTPVFVPEASDDHEAVGFVVRCAEPTGAVIGEGDVLIEVSIGAVIAEIEAPMDGRVIDLYVKAGDPIHVGEMFAMVAERPKPKPKRRPEGKRPASRSSRMLVQRAPLLLAFALAAGAVRWPFAWLVGVIVGVVVAGGIADAGLGRSRRGPADLLVVPAAVVGAALRRARRKFGEGAILLGRLALLVVAIAVALALPAGLAALSWLAGHGTDGWLAAARLGGFAWAPRILSFLICVHLLRRMLTTVGNEPVRVAASALPEIGLTAVVTIAAAWGLVCLLHPAPVWWPSTSFRAAVHGLPTALRDTVDDQRKAVVGAEARAVVRCLRGRGLGGWRVPRAHLRDDGGLLVGVRARSLVRPRSASLSSLLIALDNQLAPYGATIVVQLKRPRKQIRFTTSRSARLVTDLAQLELSDETLSLLARARQTGPARRGDALACSAAAF